MKLSEWLNIWLNKYVKHTIKVRTFERYNYIIEKHINPILGDCDLDNFSTSILQDFLLLKIENGNLKAGKGLAKLCLMTIWQPLKKLK